MEKITLLIHGAWPNNITRRIIETFYGGLREDMKSSVGITIVCYKADRGNLNNLLSEVDNEVDIPINVVEIKDLFNQGFYNINRQIFSVRKGLETIESDQFVIKLRNDQIVNFRKLFYLFKRLHYFRDREQCFITTNCYTRKHRLYHPSDMFLCGWRDDLLEYYSAPLMKETSAEWKLKMLEVLENDPEHFQKYFKSPESYLFSTYLEKKGWEFKYTEEDSYDAIKKYFYVANSWDIDYCWNKQRVPFRKAGHLILPTSGDCPPFAWDTPIKDGKGNLFLEKDGCYERSDFCGKRTKKDAYYVELAERLYHKFIYG